MSPVVRKSILVVILLLVAGAYAFEKLVVQRRPVRIQAELMEFINDTSHNYSEDEIVPMINRPCEIIFDSQQKKIVKYSWRGCSFNTYDLYVVYRKFSGMSVLSDASLLEPSPTKPFINASDIANASNNGEAPVTPDGEVPRPSKAQQTGGLVEGG